MLAHPRISSNLITSSPFDLAGCALLDNAKQALSVLYDTIYPAKGFAVRAPTNESLEDKPRNRNTSRGNQFT